MTAARTGEVLGARWSEIDLDNKIWVVPAARMKVGKEHRVPLAAPVLALLRALPREKNNDLVFIGPAEGGGFSDMAMTRVLERMGCDATVHGFRSTFSDWAHERTAHPSHAIELSLAHSVGNAVEKAYRRGDLIEKRRHLMEEWARYCSAPHKAGEVVPLAAAGRGAGFSRLRAQSNFNSIVEQTLAEQQAALAPKPRKG